MIVYQPIMSPPPSQRQLDKCTPWMKRWKTWAKERGHEYISTPFDAPIGFVWPCSEKDYTIFSRMATTPHVLCPDWDLEILPGFEVGGDEIWVGDDHCALVYNGADMLTFAKILNMWDAYRATTKMWMHERNRGWKVVNAYLREHPEAKFNRIPKSTYIHHNGEVR